MGIRPKMTREKRVSATVGFMSALGYALRDPSIPSDPEDLMPAFESRDAFRRLQHRLGLHVSDDDRNIVQLYPVAETRLVVEIRIRQKEPSIESVAIRQVMRGTLEQDQQDWSIIFHVLGICSFYGVTVTEVPRCPYAPWNWYDDGAPDGIPDAEFEN
jgi:hypothetical protein